MLLLDERCFIHDLVFSALLTSVFYTAEPPTFKAVAELAISFIPLGAKL